ncbi:cyclin-D3-1-like [Phragmites australis]|uniref:cyclin-D3-1-like n=1 Tax=Phragmites australis TaxID=29695 RepID=UPI002D78D173|nr:cyclin-D3-1-like [Phragmites australis]
MAPSYDCAASVLLCAEDNATILGLDEEGEECSWAGATPPRDTASAAGDAVEGFLTDFPLQSDDCIAALVEREVEHMPMEVYPQKLQRLHGGLDLAAVRRDAIDWIWKVIEHYNFAPLTATLSVNYLDRFLSTYELPEGKAWMTQLLAVACLSLASKMEETFVPLPLDLQVAEAKFVFEGRTIKRMELLVLSTLKWRMQAVTACSFVDYFLHKLSDHGAPSMLARSRSADLILSTAKGAEFLVFRPSEIAASVALAAIGECSSSVIERASTSSKYLSKERVLRCYEIIQEKITMGNIVLKSAGSSISSVPQSPIGVLDAAACLSQQSDDTTVGSPATCHYSSSSSKRRRISRRLI